MIGTILSGIIGVLFLTGAVMQYRCQGPIWSAEYFASSPKEKKRLRTRRAYYWSATACLLIGLSLILLMIYSLTEMVGFIYAVCVCGVLLLLLLVCGCLRAVRNSADHRRNMVMYRENLDDVFPHEIEEEIRNRRRAVRRSRVSGIDRQQVSSAKKQGTSDANDRTVDTNRRKKRMR